MDPLCQFQSIRSKQNDVHIAHYKDLGDWARHYSTVRMTVGTLFVVLAFAVVLLQWQHPTFGLLVVAAAMALFGVIVFGIFTALTFDRLNNQIAMINQARKDLDVRNRETEAGQLLDVARWVADRLFVRGDIRS